LFSDWLYNFYFIVFWYLDFSVTHVTFLLLITFFFLNGSDPSLELFAPQDGPVSNHFSFMKIVISNITNIESRIEVLEFNLAKVNKFIRWKLENICFKFLRSIMPNERDRGGFQLGFK
jgi:hypothetical protein